MWRRSTTIWASTSLPTGWSKIWRSAPTVMVTLPPWTVTVPIASNSEVTACHSMLWLTGCSKIWRSVFRWRLSRCGDSGEDDIVFPSGLTLPGHVLVVGVDGVRFDFLGPDSAPSVWALGQAGFLAQVPVDEATPTWAGLPTLLAVSGWPPLALAADGGPLFAEASTREFTAVPRTGLAWDAAREASQEDGLAAWDAADEAISARAAAILAGQAPRVSFVYLGAVDFAGHATGSGATYRAALLAADQRVGRLVAAVRSRPSGPEEDWTIVVVTDHGHLDEGGHGGREPEVATAWAAAAGPGIRPGGPPSITRQEEVAPLVLAAA